jgi:hypothetical protein
VYPQGEDHGHRKLFLTAKFAAKEGFLEELKNELMSLVEPTRKGKGLHLSIIFMLKQIIRIICLL